ncbi:ExeA family protein [Methylotetracoccus oryzae]|uniref:ExeA family protein n=1 Tax=Methylotetracoccus oryzae TaxID=1919059 RepID=UPI0011182F94|nr:ExeA family protein [Methylotetracoccus oryzae]
MYLKHFGFDAAPFAINPDPRFLYLSHQHQEALAHLLYGLGEGGGFVMLSGEVGAGKTTLCYSLLENLGGDVDVAFIMNPRLGAVELLAALCDELHVPYPPATESCKVLIDALNRFLLENHSKGRRTVAVIDEAQHLSTDVLEQIRLLTNLETPTTKLLQIILVGQPELSDLLARREVRQVDQRITARYHLGPLNEAETQRYVHHRLRVAGGNADLFSTRALAEIFRTSGGVPRLINVICDRALLGAYTLDRLRVDVPIVRKAAREVHRIPTQAALPRWQKVAGVLFVVVAVASLVPWPGRHGESAVSLTVARNDPTAPPAEPITPPQPVAALDPPKGDAGQVMPVNLRPPRPALHLWVADPVFAQERQALGQVVQLWQPQRAFEAISCAPLIDAGLRCLHLRRGWERLLRLNLPAVLKLRLNDGQSRFVALIGGDSEHAWLAGKDGTALSYPLVELLPLWTGESIVLWKPPTKRKTYFMPGNTYSGIPLMRRQLEASGFPAMPEGPPERFDATLREAVIAFQQTLGIRADGIIGPETQADLSAALPRSGMPTLRDGANP